MKNARYLAYLKSEKWQALVEIVARRAEYRCERCESDEEYEYNVHHLTYERVYNERLSDLVYLCKKCHRYEHGKTKGPNWWASCDNKSWTVANGLQVRKAEKELASSIAYNHRLVEGLCREQN
jgi:HNH endonuclease